MSKSVYDANGNGVVDNAEKLGGHAASYFSPATHNHDSVYQPAGTYAAPAEAKIVSLAIANWTGEAAPFAQTITVEGMTAEARIIVSPAPASLDAYGAVGVRCTEQGANSLTFSCDSAPESDLTVNILIVG